MHRDLELVPLAESALDTTMGLANAMNAVMSTAGPKVRNARAVELVREIVTRHGALTLALAPAVVMYRADMTEAELRAWAADMMGAMPR